MKTINRHHRRSIRLKEYDYSHPDEYFVTICTHNHECMLGEIINGELRLNAIGKIVKEEWLRTAIIRPDIQLDLYEILLHALRVTVTSLRLSNHIHGIIVLNEGRGTLQRAPTVERFGKPTSNSIPTIVRLFKSATTKHINEIRGTAGIRFWQRNYYDRVIRNDKELDNIRDYIHNNILQWAF